ncbi:MAG: hypothetical protein ABIQ05_05495 [Candidatus Limnocylindria bacterium]
MIRSLASVVVMLLGLYLAGFAIVSLSSPARAQRFLGGLASSAFAHYLELLLRFIAGGALLLAAPQMLFSAFFVIVGWVLIVTTVGLLAIPWQWHHRFAKWAVPNATANLRLVAIASFAFGGVVTASVIIGRAI